MPGVLLTDQVRGGPGLADGRHHSHLLRREDRSQSRPCSTAAADRILIPNWPNRKRLSLIPTDEDRFRDRKFACFPLDVTAGRIGLCPKMVRREGKKPEVIVVWPMAVRRTRAAIARFPKIVEGLLLLCVLPGPLRKLRYGRRNIVDAQ
jgi:hypothetical protein